MRFVGIGGLIVLGFIAVIVQICKIGTAERDKWQRVAAKQEPVLVEIEATRGNIFDCHGNLLASSMPQYNVYMDTQVEALRQENGRWFYENLDSIAIGLSKVVGDKSAEEYRKLIRNGYNQKQTRLKLTSRRINYIEQQELKKIPIRYKLPKKADVPKNIQHLTLENVYKSGVFFEDQYSRVKPFGRLASKTIGDIQLSTGKASKGIEEAFDTQLRGTNGRGVKERRGGIGIIETKKKAVDGIDVVSTIDIELQDIVENLLLEAVEEGQEDWGCCLLMEVKTGEIKAIANLDRTKGGNYYEGMNHAVVKVEPGSTFKTIALMAALDDGKIDIDDTVRVFRNGWRYFNTNIIDAHKRDTVYDVRSALAASSNIALARIITHAYEGSAKKFVNRIRKIGIMDSVYCEIGGDQAWIPVPKDTVTLSKMSYGYSVELTPMQIMMFYNAIANDGKMVRPYLVKALQKNGEVVKEFDTEVVKSSICSSKTLRDLKGALHDVVWDNHLGTASNNGYGRKAQSKIVAIAGKTGTAQIHEGNYTNQRHRMSFVGYFPEEEPVYTCICVLHNPHAGSHDAGAKCGTVVRKIAERTMAQTGCYVVEDGEKKLTINQK